MCMYRLAVNFFMCLLKWPCLKIYILCDADIFLISYHIIDRTDESSAVALVSHMVTVITFLSSCSMHTLPLDHL